MMRIERRWRIGLLLLLCSLASCSKRSAAVQTRPKDFSLFMVSQIQGRRQAPPTIVLRIDTASYPGVPSYLKFLRPGPPHSPEECCTRYIDALHSSRPDSQKLRPLFLPSENRKAVAEIIKYDGRAIHGSRDITYLRRYDLGALTHIIAYDLEPKGERSFKYEFDVRSVGSRYYIRTLTLNSDALELVHLVENAIDMLNPGWNVHPTSRFKYSLRLPNSVAGDTTTRHPVIVSFNGSVSYLLIDKNTKPKDGIQAFVKHVAQVFRMGTKREFMRLWTAYDISDFFGPQLKDFRDDETGIMPGGPLDFFWNRNTIHLVFTIDAGPEAFVFLQKGDNPNEPLLTLALVKQHSGEYRMSYLGELANEDVTISELHAFTESPELDHYLKSIVQQYRNMTAGTGPVKQPSGGYKTTLRERLASEVPHLVPAQTNLTPSPSPQGIILVRYFKEELWTNPHQSRRSPCCMSRN